MPYGIESLSELDAKHNRVKERFVLTHYSETSAEWTNDTAQGPWKDPAVQFKTRAEARKALTKLRVGNERLNGSKVTLRLFKVE